MQQGRKTVARDRRILVTLSFLAFCILFYSCRERRSHKRLCQASNTVPLSLFPSGQEKLDSGQRSARNGYPDWDCTQAHMRLSSHRDEQGGSATRETGARETKALQPG